MFTKFLTLMILSFTALFSIFQLELLGQQYLLQFPHSTALQFLFFGFIALASSATIYFLFRQGKVKQGQPTGISITELSIDLPNLGTKFLLGFMKGLGSR